MTVITATFLQLDFGPGNLLYSTKYDHMTVVTEMTGVNNIAQIQTDIPLQVSLLKTLGPLLN